MKLNSRKIVGSRPSLEISMTSMIDVVFLLLIFFLVTTTFIRPERQMTSNIKVDRSDAGLQESDLDPAVVDLFKVGDRIFYQLGAIKSTKLDDLTKVLNEFENKSDGAFVRVGEQVPFNNAAQAIGLLKSNGFPNVSYLPAD